MTKDSLFVRPSGGVVSWLLRGGDAGGWVQGRQETDLLDSVAKPSKPGLTNPPTNVPPLDLFFALVPPLPHLKTIG